MVARPDQRGAPAVAGMSPDAIAAEVAGILASGYRRLRAAFPPSPAAGTHVAPRIARRAQGLAPGGREE